MYEALNYVIMHQASNLVGSDILLVKKGTRKTLGEIINR